MLDPHGQPFNVRFNRARRAERDLSELLGLAKGVRANGTVSGEEATDGHDLQRPVVRRSVPHLRVR